MGDTNSLRDIDWGAVLGNYGVTGEKNKRLADLISQHTQEARIDEVEKMIKFERSVDTSNYSYVNIQHIKDRLKALTLTKGGVDESSGSL